MLLLSFYGGAGSISAIDAINGKCQLAKYLRIRELWRVERGGGLKFQENKKCFKK